MTSLIEEFLPHVSASCTPDQVEALEAAGYVDLYILREDGKIFRKMTLSHGRKIILEVKSFPKEVPKTSAIQESLAGFLPGGKIPLQVFHQIRAFFQKVCETHGQALEAHCYILWNQTDGYHVFVPEQTVSGGTVEFSYSGLPAGSAIVVDIHSHGSMSAFFSGTDDTNDKNHIYFSGVIGKVNTDKPEVTFRFNMFEVKRPATLGDIFCESQIPVTVPDEWMDKVKKRSYGGTTYTPGSWMGTDWGRDKDDWRNWGKTAGLTQGNNSVSTPNQKKVEPGTGGRMITASSELEDRATFYKRIWETDPLDDEDEVSYVKGQFGVGNGDLYKEVSKGIAALQGKDELLKKVIADAYEAMSSEGQSSISTNGL